MPRAHKFVAHSFSTFHPEKLEAAIHKKWLGVDDGAELHKGIPEEDLFAAQKERLRRANGIVDKIVKKIALIKTNGTWSTGMHVYLYEGRAKVMSCILTAGHVLPTVQAAKKSLATLNFQKNLKTAPWTRLDPDTLYWKSPKADVAVCALADMLPRVPELRIMCQAPRALRMGETVRILQHPNASPLVYDVGHVVLPSTSNSFFLHNVNTLPGSSGAPILDYDWNVIGIHVGATDMSTETGIVKVNEGCYVTEVAAALKRKGFTMCPSKSASKPASKPGRAPAARSKERARRSHTRPSPAPKPRKSRSSRKSR